MARIFLLTAAATLASAASIINETAFAPSDIIKTDVAIIGGGASGTYAAVRLRQDLNTSVLVIETKGRLVCLPFELFILPCIC